MDLKKADALMALPAIACNIVDWSARPEGMRIVFGELPIIADQEPRCRVAVLLPWPIAEAMVQTMTKTIAETKQVHEAMQEQRGKSN